jgi:hypothetical protein
MMSEGQKLEYTVLLKARFKAGAEFAEWNKKNAPYCVWCGDDGRDGGEPDKQPEPPEDHVIEGAILKVNYVQAQAAVRNYEVMMGVKS